MDRHTLERQVYTVPEVAKVMGSGRTLVYQLVKEGRLPVPSIRLGRRIVIPKAAVDRLLSGKDASAEKEPVPQRH